MPIPASLAAVRTAYRRRAAHCLALCVLLAWPTAAAAAGADEAHYEALMEAASAAYETRDYAAAARLWGDAVREAEAFGRLDSRLAAGLNSLAEARRAQARYRDSARLTRRALAIWQTTLGPDHPVVALALGHLGLAMRLQGRFADAEPLLRRALAITGRASGPGSGQPDMADALGQLALLRKDQGRYVEARRLFLRRLPPRQSV
jgi:tetratricopeptide (TPR) repeat protein